MGKYKKIAVIYGSDSSEWEVSCRSGEFTASRIDEFQYDVYEVFARFGKWNLVAMRKANSMRQAFPEGAQPVVDKSDFSVMVLGEKIKFDFAYIMQHGAPGETGLLQGYFEMLGIPHSTCSAFVTTVAFDKYACKSYLRGKDLVKMAPDAIIHRGEDIEEFCSATVAALGLPLFVKPTRAGSSFGITKVERAEDLPAAVRFAFTEGEQVIVEKAVKMAQMMNVPVFGLVENMSYYQCPHCGEKEYIYGQSHIEETAAKYGIGHVARIPIERDIAGLCDAGRIEDYRGDWLDEIGSALVRTLES